MERVTHGKIGIITLSASDNCGSLLQTYALRELLKDKYDAEVIHFSTQKSHEQYDMFPQRVRRNWWEIIKRMRHIIGLWGEKRDYEVFRKSYIRMNTKKEYLPEDLHKIADKYDIIVAGSDQIWNVRMSDFDESFFAGWANCRKIAYAPSLGGYDIRDSKNSQQIVNWLLEFESLSVREELGQKCLEEITGRDVKLVLDPTLVLPKRKWEQLIGKPLIQGDYIFYYSWAYCYDELSDIVAKDGADSHMRVCVTDAHKWLHRRNLMKKYRFELCSKGGPLAFLNLMYYAKRVYVESFHGLVFAYIFRKDVWILNTSEDLQADDIRLYELSNLLGMQNRMLCPQNRAAKNLKEPVRYAENLKLKDALQQSRTYLKESLGIDV
jgi:hypothetical protein